MRLLLEGNPEHTEIEPIRGEAQTAPCPKPAPYLIPAAFILEEQLPNREAASVKSDNSLCSRRLKTVEAWRVLPSICFVW